MTSVGSQRTVTRYRAAGLTPRERHDAEYAELVKHARRVIEVGIPTRDGVVLAADVYLPDAAQLPAPAIVCVNTGYDKSGELRLVSPITGRPEPHHSGFGFPHRESVLYQDSGYVYVINDERGRGKSGGTDSDVMKAGLPGPYGDGPDAFDVIEWVARQPWCNGKVGTSGGSMLASSQYTAAFERPPHLSCMMPIAAGGLWLTERGWDHGCYALYQNVSMAIRTRGRIMDNLTLATTDWEQLLTQLPLERVIAQLGHAPTTEVLHHDTLDDWWQPRLLDGRRRELTMPALHIAGWVDRAQTYGMLKGYEWSRQSPAADQQWLIVGPWTHADAIYYPGHVYQGLDLGRDAAIELDQIKMDWFGRWLRGDEASWSGVPKVQLFETGSNVWRSGDDWPLAGSDRELYFSGGTTGELSAVLPDSASKRTYRYDPMDPVMPSGWGKASYDLMEQSYLDGRADVLRYTSLPAREEVAISGWPRVIFVASTDCDDTEWHIRLADVHPDGRSFEVAAGRLRASYRESLARPSPLMPNDLQEYQLVLTPVTHAFMPGHSIRVTITSSDFPAYARSLNRFGSYATLADPRIAQQTVHHGRNTPSRIVLPVTRGCLPT
jgi:uncharacterized protein